MAKFTEAEALSIVAGERQYLRRIKQHAQDRGCSFNVSDFILMMEHHLMIARTSWAISCSDVPAMAEIRKLAGVCQWCIEEHGAPDRPSGAT